MIIVVAGTPGVGKSSLASYLVRLLNLAYASLTEVILYAGAWVAYEWLRRSFIIDDLKATRAISRLVRRKGGLVLETHDIELVWTAGVEPQILVVLRSRPSILYKRLVARGWPLRKIVENMEAELVGVVSAEAREYYEWRRVCELDTSSLSVRGVFKRVLDALKRGVEVCEGQVDWLSIEEEVEFVSRISGSL